MEAERNRPYLTGIQHNGCLTVVTENDNGTLHLESLVPGQFDKAKCLLPAELYEQVEELWTEDLIAGYRQSLKEDEDGEL